MAKIKRFDQLNEARLGTGINIYSYVMAYEFAKWVEFEFNVKDAYHKLLKSEYIEGSLGSRWTKPVEIENEIDQWFAKFLDDFDLDEIQLKYGQ